MDTTTAAHDAASRRAFLRRAGLAVGAAAASVPAFARVAAAQEDTDTTAGGTDTTTGGGDTTAAGGDTTAAPASTTTTLPRRPEPGDVEVLVFAQSLELANVAAYGQIVSAGLLDEEHTKIARLFQRHHQAHADAFAGMASSAALNTANPAYADELSGLVDGAVDQAAALDAALTIENRAIAFYIGALEEVVALEPAELFAEIVPADGRHAVVLAQAIGLSLDDYVPSAYDAQDAPTPADYPLDDN